MKKMLIIYFSGTGNTFRAVNIVRDYLTGNNIRVDMLEVNANAEFVQKKYDEYLFAFPIYAFSPPVIYSDFLKKIPKVDNKNASLLITSAASLNREQGYGGYAPYYIKNILIKKGYQVKRTREIGFPEYWTQLINPPATEECKEITKRSDVKVSDFADEILHQKEISIRKPYISEIVFFKYIIPFYNLFIGKTLGKFFIADKKCTGCKLCVRLCPAGAIKMSGPKPEWNNRCMGCNRCINFCPQKSIQTSIIRLFLHVVLAAFLYFVGIKITLNLISGLIFELPLFFIVLIKIISALIALIIMLILQVTVYDYLIGLLERFVFLRPLFELSFTKNYRRQKAEGFLEKQKGPI